MKTKWKITLIAMIVLVALNIFIREPTTVHAATSPYDVDTSVKTGWDKKYGGKNKNMDTGMNLVYDIYSEKYNQNGYSIVTKDFGKGSMKYVRFQGWSVLFGHKRHTDTNHETYIVAEDAKNSSNIKIYGTIPYGNLKATEDLEYNKNASTSTTVWNECPASTTNTINTECNMTYTNVGFDAYLPMDELFPDAATTKKWKLYLVKRVDSQIVYTQLNVPFEFENKKHLGGTVQLTSGVDARTLQMNADPVIRRTAPRTNESGLDIGYFTKGSSYKAVTQDEDQTAIWFGVRSPKDDNKTRWASSSYWNFGGEQAELSFTPEDAPPTHIAHSMTSTYKNGNDYWVQPGTPVEIALRQRDVDSGNKYQYLNLIGNGVEVRKRHAFEESTTNMTSVSDFSNTSDLAINKALRVEDSSYGKVEWTATPKTHGHNYAVKYYYTDLANNSIGYNDTGMNLRVDGNAPVRSTESITGATYVDGDNYWVQSDKVLKVNSRQRDVDSGNKYQYLRAIPDGNESDSVLIARSRHDFNDVATTNVKQSTDSRFTIQSAKRTEDTTYGNVEWTVIPNKHNGIYTVQTFFQDNVNNNSGYSTIGTIRVDDEAPTKGTEAILGASYRNGDDYWVKSNDPLKITITQRDAQSGNKYQYLRFLNNGNESIIEARSRHDFAEASTHNLKQNTGPKVDIQSATRSITGSVRWDVTANTHGQTYTVQRYFQDNVNNSAGYDNIGNIKVDDVAPTVSFRNDEDTANFYTNSSKNAGNVSVRLKFADADSGYKRSRYSWSKSETTPSTWSEWNTSSNYLVTQNESGEWYLHVQSEDNVGNVTDVYKGIYYAFMNQPPVANITYNPSPVYNDTMVNLMSNAYDPDGDTLTYQWAYQKPNSTTWVDFSKEESPVQLFNTKGDWNVRVTVSDGLETITATKKIPVINRPPVANFKWNPTTVYNNTNVTFVNSSTDPDKDTLTYQWAYQEPNSTTWVDFSTDATPSKLFAKKGDWNIRLTVSDGTTSHAATKVLTVENRPPVAVFDWNPKSVYTNTSVKFMNTSTDIDKDDMTYQWSYQEPSSTTWVDFSTEATPTKTFAKKGNWNIRLTVSDGTTTHAATKVLSVLNTAPEVSLTYAPTVLFEGDTVTLTARPKDLDGDKTKIVFEENVDGTWTKLFEKADVAPNTDVCHSFVAKPKPYEIRVRATDDSNGTGTATVKFTVKALEITGMVNHTPEWQKTHDDAEHEENQFFSGEIFVTSALVTDYPITSVTVTFQGKQVNGQTLKIEGPMLAKHPTYTKDIFDPVMSNVKTKLENGLVHFVFTAKWKNGVVKQDVIGVNIVDSTYQAYDIQRTN